MQDVQSGSVEILLTKPVSYLAYRMWWQIGLGFYSFVVMSVVGVAVLALLFGFPSTMANFVFFPSLFLTFVASALLSLFLYSIIGLLAFWLEDVNPVFWIVDKFVMILGGSYLPVALFPPLMYKFAVYSPFGASQFITHVVYDSWKNNWLFLVGIQLFWIILLGLVLHFVFQKAKQKVSVNGG
jgi:ABC-2 type transport system permease protein